MSTPPPTPMPAHLPAGATPEGDGIRLGDGPVQIDAYIDFQCPYCRQFEETSAATLYQLIDENLANVVYHPLGFLDRLSTTAYSTRASAASGCASDGGRFAEYKDALFANQPPEGGPGLSDEQLIELGATVGLSPRSFAACVIAGRYRPWTAFVTEQALRRGVSGTPTVLVAGHQVRPTPDAIVAAVAAVAERARP